MHTNMFHAGLNSTEVYSAFNEHYERDTKDIRRNDALAVCGIILIFVDSLPTWLTFLNPNSFHLGGALLLFYAFRNSLFSFIDNSNRNWAMHLIDWMGEADSTNRKCRFVCRANPQSAIDGVRP